MKCRKCGKRLYVQNSYDIENTTLGPVRRRVYKCKCGGELRTYELPITPGYHFYFETLRGPTLGKL